MEERYIASIDLGSSKLALTVARIDGENVQVIYYKETPSDGIYYSYVRNPMKVEAPLSAALKEAENELNIKKIRQVVVGLPRYYVYQETAKGRIERDGSCITQEEVESLKEFALNSYPIDDEKNEVLYGAVAQSFSTEDCFQQVEGDIVGMVSNILEGNFKVFIGRKRPLENIDVVMNHLDVAIARKYFLPEVVAKAVLSSEEMENGVALIDFGAGATSVTVYKGKIMRYYGAIPFGGKAITNDIHTECGISESLAENIKMAYGACMPDKLQNLGEKIIQFHNEKDVPYKQLSVKYLSEIISARAAEIVNAALYLIQESGYADDLRNGVVITGGGANLTNLANFVKELSGYTVRTGYPRHLFSATGCPGIYDTGAVSSIGMILAAKGDTHLNCLDKPRPKPVPAQEPVLPEEEVPAQEEPMPENWNNAKDGTLIDKEEFGEEKKEKKEGKRGPKEPKAPKGPRRPWPVWTKISKIGESVGETLFKLTEDMNNESV